MAESRFQLWSALENIIRSPTSIANSQHQQQQATANQQQQSTQTSILTTASADSNPQLLTRDDSVSLEQPKEAANNDDSWISIEKAQGHIEANELSKRTSPDSLYAIVSENLKSNSLINRFSMASSSQPTTNVTLSSGAAMPSSQPQDQSEEINKRLNVISYCC